jgi:hypothetical protein
MKSGAVAITPSLSPPPIAHMQSAILGEFAARSVSAVSGSSRRTGFAELTSPAPPSGVCSGSPYSRITGWRGLRFNGRAVAFWVFVAFWVVVWRAV